uniref:Uncharacterized protein n=1 Tax=Arundo donax TaxID=35708 RepID=A0A0A8ZTA8_ARUDO
MLYKIMSVWQSGITISPEKHNKHKHIHSSCTISTNKASGGSIVQNIVSLAFRHQHKVQCWNSTNSMGKGVTSQWINGQKSSR